MPEVFELKLKAFPTVAASKVMQNTASSTNDGYTRLRLINLTRRSPHDLFVKERVQKVKKVIIKNGQKMETEEIKKFNLPDDCSVAVFHGKPNPAEIEHDPLVKENWK